MLHWLVASAGGRAAIDDISVAGIRCKPTKKCVTSWPGPQFGIKINLIHIAAVKRFSCA